MDNNFIYNIGDNDVIITGYKNKMVTHMEIPKFIDGLPVTYIRNCAFSNCSELLEITIPKSISYIGFNIVGWSFKLKVINNVNIGKGVNIIGDNLIYFGTYIYPITYQIGSDYYGDNYFIDGEFYFKWFTNKLRYGV